MSNRSNERAAIPSFGTEVGSGRHRARTALLSGALVVALVIAAVVAWRVVNRHAGTATVKGTVTSVDPSASTLTVMPAEHVASAARMRGPVKQPLAQRRLPGRATTT